MRGQYADMFKFVQQAGPSSNTFYSKYGEIGSVVRKAVEDMYGFLKSNHENNEDGGSDNITVLTESVTVELVYRLLSGSLFVPGTNPKFKYLHDKVKMFKTKIDQERIINERELNEQLKIDKAKLKMEKAASISKLKLAKEKAKNINSLKPKRKIQKKKN